MIQPPNIPDAHRALTSNPGNALLNFLAGLGDWYRNQEAQYRAAYPGGTAGRFGAIPTVRPPDPATMPTSGLMAGPARALAGMVAPRPAAAPAMAAAGAAGGGGGVSSAGGEAPPQRARVVRMPASASRGGAANRGAGSVAPRGRASTPPRAASSGGSFRDSMERGRAGSGMPAPAPSYGPTPDAAGMADAVFATGPAAPASGIPELLPLPPMPEEIQAPAQPYPMTWGAALSALPQATGARIAPGAAAVPPMDTTGMTLQQINALRNQAVMRILGLAPGAANPGDGGGGGFF